MIGSKFRMAKRPTMFTIGVFIGIFDLKMSVRGIVYEKSGCDSAYFVKVVLIQLTNETGEIRMFE